MNNAKKTSVQVCCICQNMLDTDWDLLTGKEMCEHDAKMMVEEMVYDHFADEKRYYEEICEELDMEN